MADLKGKKLLILGSNTKSIDFVNYAKELGVYTIVTDWYAPDNNLVKMSADEHWEISLLDYDNLSKAIKDNNVNGVITGFTDSYLLPYQHLCELTGLPCYATKEVFETTLDKSMFKRMCEKHGIPTIPEYNAKTIDTTKISPANKIIIKPVDNSGSRGIVVCDNQDKFDECLSYSLSFSQKKEVVIEKYIDLDSISMSYTIQDGVVSLSTVNDSYIHKVPGKGASTCGSVYPSKYIDFYLNTYDASVRKMLKEEGFRNGVLFIQAFTNGIEFYVIEMGYRVSGGRHYIWTDFENNSNGMKQLIHFALTGKMADYSIIERDNPKFRHLCCRVYIMGKSAVIAKIEGLDKVRQLPEVVECLQVRRVGDKIGEDGTSAQQIAVVNMVVNSLSEFEKTVKYISSVYKVFDNDGNNLVLDLLK